LIWHNDNGYFKKEMLLLHIKMGVIVFVVLMLHGIGKMVFIKYVLSAIKSLLLDHVGKKQHFFVQKDVQENNEKTFLNIKRQSGRN